MVLPPIQIAAALDAVSEHLALAETAFFRGLSGDPYGEDTAEWHLQIAFVQLLVIAEAEALPQLRHEILRDFEAARAEGLTTGVADPDGEPYLKWATPPRRYVAALQATLANEPSRTVTKDVESILRAANYSLSDPALFQVPPPDESAVHRRLEGILRCVFPDLLHKPRLPKPIKQFEPDTGLPSIRTLIEYKYLSSAPQVAALADELLADTRGYTSKDWTSFVYVIYETARFRPENEWRQLLRACDVDSRTTVVVLSGESRKRGANKLSALPSRRRGRRTTE